MNAPCRIVLTRSREDCVDWARRLAEAGVTPIVYPCIATHTATTPALPAQLAAELARADWLVVTSRRGVDAVATLHGTQLPAGLRIAAVGPRTAAAATSTFGRIDLTGTGTAADLGRALAAECAPDTRVLLCVAANARDTVERALAGCSVVRLDVYRTLPAAAPAPPEAPLGLASLAADAVWFASPSAVTGFCRRTRIDAAPDFVSIGPSTTEALRSAGLAPAAEAGTQDFTGLLEATRCQTPA